MASGTQLKATVDDLYREKGKAELIGGRIIPLMPTGRKPNRTAARIFKSLDDYAEVTGQGEAYTDNMGFTVPELSSGRESFSPDVSFYSGPFLANDMLFIAGPPTFAVEVRSKSDYGEAAEAEMAAKRADYFEAGTRVVWDVDPKAESVNIYRHDAPEHPITRGRGETADAEPAVLGWSMPVDRIFT
ncbi:MAG TPA: Uma2 family endonuclease [Isosphaeraceae bacterium]|nr:Uma2 family endonuclease [Isosphaeraceae bacterium]